MDLYDFGVRSPHDFNSPGCWKFPDPPWWLFFFPHLLSYWRLANKDYDKLSDQEKNLVSRYLHYADPQIQS